MADEYPEYPDLDPDVVRAFLDVLAPYVAPGETGEDLLNGAVELGRRRAQLFDRELSPTDVEFALDLTFCRWPFKPPKSPEYVRAVEEIRVPMFRELSRGDIGIIGRVVPDETLTLSFEELFERQQEESIGNLFRVYRDGDATM